MDNLDYAPDMTLPQVGPIAERHSLEEYRRSDFVGATDVAARINAVFSTKAIDRVFVNRGKKRDVLPVYNGDVCVPLADLSQITINSIARASRFKGGNLIAIGDVIKKNEEGENARAREVAERIIPGLIAKLNKAFTGDKEVALRHIQDIVQGRGFVLPLRGHELPDVNWNNNIPVSEDPRWEKDDKVRNERNDWFKNSVAPLVKDVLRKHFIENILPRFEGKVYYDYYRSVDNSIDRAKDETLGQFIDNNFVPDKSSDRRIVADGDDSVAYYWQRDFANWCNGIETGKLTVFFNLDGNFKYQAGYKWGHFEECGQAFVVGFANRHGQREHGGIESSNIKIDIVNANE